MIEREQEGGPSHASAFSPGTTVGVSVFPSCFYPAAVAEMSRYWKDYGIDPLIKNLAGFSNSGDCILPELDNQLFVYCLLLNNACERLAFTLVNRNGGIRLGIGYNWLLVSCGHYSRELSDTKDIKSELKKTLVTALCGHQRIEYQQLAFFTLEKFTVEIEGHIKERYLLPKISFHRMMDQLVTPLVTPEEAEKLANWMFTVHSEETDLTETASSD